VPDWFQERAKTQAPLLYPGKAKRAEEATNRFPAVARARRHSPNRAWLDLLDELCHEDSG